MIRMKVFMLILGLVLFVLCEPAEGAAADAGQGVADNATRTAEPGAGARWVEPETGLTFRWIPAGCFVMGSPRGEPGRDRDEGPQHRVCLSGFWLGETEVTQGQWTAIMGDNPSLIQNGEEQPVDMISWNRAKKFVAAVNARAGGGFRLPTEAEWEYACRAGTTTAYSFGETITTDQASFDRPYRLAPEPAPAGKRKGRKRKPAKRPQRIWPNMHTSVVGSFPANAFGLRDMHGNLWEWCQDTYDAAYYARSPRENPVCKAESPSRVLRGGSWISKAAALRSANRSRGWPDLGTIFSGVRLARTAKPAAQTPAPAAQAPDAEAAR